MKIINTYQPKWLHIAVIILLTINSPLIAQNLEIIKQSDYKNWTLETAKPKEIGILAKRIENVPGTHEIKYESEVDSISIKHTAHSREGFALGAVIAAEWIHDKAGVYTMKDVLNIG